MACLTEDMAVHIHTEEQNKLAPSQHCLSNGNKDLIIMYIKTYIIRTHTREMKTVLVLSRAKCNKNIDYASAT